MPHFKNARFWDRLYLISRGAGGLEGTQDAHWTLISDLGLQIH